MIVVTGGSGFLGSWILRTLSGKGLSVTALVRPGSDCWRIKDLRDVNIIRSDPSGWPKVITQLSPRVVVASDWEGVDGPDRGDREKQFQNISRSFAVAEAAKKTDVKVFITFGSQAEIGPHLYPLTETEEDNPLSAYGEAKVQLRMKLCELFSDTGVRFVWGRIFSIYGPLDTNTGMLPTLISTLNKEEIFRATNGDQTWSYLYAGDLALAVLKIIDEQAFNQIVNIGNPNAVRIRDVIELVAQYMNHGELIHFGTKEIDNDQSQYLVPVTSQLSSNGWEPVTRLNEGIRTTVDWFTGTSAVWQGKQLPKYSIF